VTVAALELGTELAPGYGVLEPGTQLAPGYGVLEPGTELAPGYGVLQPGAALAPGCGVLQPGAALAPGYRVLEHLRRGSCLDVYDVWSVERRARCVAKVLRPERATSGSDRRRLLREGRLLARLTHPHIVRIYAVLREPQPALILETLTGATLAHLIAQAPRGLGARNVAILGLQLCSAGAYLHERAILHLDLKPSNIVAEAGQAKVLDLDIARRPGRGRGEGTRQYMAPEQARRGTLAAATDVWGIGMVLFEALAGHLPFDVEQDACPQLTVRAARVRSLRPRVPAPLAEVIDAALEPAPADRPSVDELARTLGLLVDDAPRW
jgi:serine/threonine protein kinase